MFEESSKSGGIFRTQASIDEAFCECTEQLTIFTNQIRANHCDC